MQRQKERNMGDFTHSTDQGEIRTLNSKGETTFSGKRGEKTFGVTTRNVLIIYLKFKTIKHVIEKSLLDNRYCYHFFVLFPPGMSLCMSKM